MLAFLQGLFARLRAALDCVFEPVERRSLEQGFDSELEALVEGYEGAARLDAAVTPLRNGFGASTTCVLYKGMRSTNNLSEQAIVRKLERGGRRELPVLGEPVREVALPAQETSHVAGGLVAPQPLRGRRRGHPSAPTATPIRVAAPLPAWALQIPGVVPYARTPSQVGHEVNEALRTRTPRRRTKAEPVPPDHRNLERFYSRRFASGGPPSHKIRPAEKC